MKGLPIPMAAFDRAVRLGALGALWTLVALPGCGPAGGEREEGAGAASTASVSQLPTSSGEPSQERLPPPGEAWVIFGSDTVHAELARTPEERQMGLMYRESLEPGRGMLFVFSDSQTRGFWMANTFIPLDIAYLDENLRIVDIQAMEPETTDPYNSARPAMFALEVPQGWFAEKGIGIGAEAKVVFGPG